ncbi:tannase and feruloyl esterase [Ramaria rubella]|nr:tannase and feruloyl esterase [Ramaria rubella]
MFTILKKIWEDIQGPVADAHTITIILRLLNLMGIFRTPQMSNNSCLALRDSLKLENTTILDVGRIKAGEQISTPGSCRSTTTVTADACRVYAVVNTTAQSAVKFEMWLPDTWFGRFLAVGNGGLGGCIDYRNLDYGNTLHFATIASDNGHDGENGLSLLNHPEVINDFAFRAIHVEAVLGKQIVEAYYQHSHHKSYYLGCSTGGRQGMQSALLFPKDFDGILAGAPAADFNHLLGWSGMLARYMGFPNANTSDKFIPTSLWPTITQEILNQCDEIDGVKDRIITEPDSCIFRPEALLCDNGAAKRYNCITLAQVNTLRQVYKPLLGTRGQLLYPRYDPGAEGNGNFETTMSGAFPYLANDWFKFTVFNDSHHSLDNFSVTDVEFSDIINPGGISTWNGDFSAFRDQGGKIITYHGRQDPLIPSGNSKRLYNLISSTLSMRTLDDFYRLFLIPGMNHCGYGPGAWAFGQSTLRSNAVNDTEHNVLLALVDWVENGHPPDTIVGTVGTGDLSERVHCRYPQQSVWDGKEFICHE